jgi:hypothetical protein
MPVMPYQVAQYSEVAVEKADRQMDTSPEVVAVEVMLWELTAVSGFLNTESVYCAQ